MANVTSGVTIAGNRHPITRTPISVVRDGAGPRSF